MTETFATMLIAWVALSTAAISPGPNMVAVASRGLDAGRQPALMVAGGIAVGAFFWAILTVVGLGALFEAAPILLKLLGLVGGLYLAWLGFKGWRSAITGSVSEIKARDGKAGHQDFWYGLMITATNPKVALLWVSLATFVGKAVLTLPSLLLFASVSTVLMFLIYGAYGLLFSTGGARVLYERFRQVSDAMFGTIFALLGFGMVIRVFYTG